MSKFFTIQHQDSKTKARTGIIHTAHSDIQTPCFLPDATYGAVKHLSTSELINLGQQIILGNVYHLGLRPGTEFIKKQGGLGKFMNWNGPILTDSGGWQVFSLVYTHKLGQVKEDGIEFKDPLTGDKHFLTPENSIQQQLDLGSDILMALDYPIAPGDLGATNERSVRLTLKWAKICVDKFKGQKNKSLFAIIQGASDKKLRQTCFENLEKIYDFPGYGYGGVPEDQEVLAYTATLIPNQKVRYVMGYGSPFQIIKAVAMGWDLFDCVIPTRNARHGLAYTFKGEIKIMQEKYREDQNPIEADCPCLACQNHTRAYVRHLLKVGEPLGARLMTIHNLTFYNRLLSLAREKIAKGTLSSLIKELEKNYKP